MSKIAVGMCRTLILPFIPSLFLKISLTGNQNGKPLGYAHVEFVTKSSAVKVFKDNEDHPVMIGGRPVRIDFAWPRKPKDPQRDVDRASKPPSPTLFLGNLPPETTQEDIIEVLAPIGIVMDVRIGALPCKSG